MATLDGFDERCDTILIYVSNGDEFGGHERNDGCRRRRRRGWAPLISISARVASLRSSLTKSVSPWEQAFQIEETIEYEEIRTRTTGNGQQAMAGDGTKEMDGQEIGEKIGEKEKKRSAMDYVKRPVAITCKCLPLVQTGQSWKTIQLNPKLVHQPSSGFARFLRQLQLAHRRKGLECKHRLLDCFP